MEGSGWGEKWERERWGERDREMWETVKERFDHAEKLDQNHIRAFPNVSVRLKEGVLYTSYNKGPSVVNRDTSMSLYVKGISITSAGTCHSIAGLHSFEQLNAELN